MLDFSEPLKGDQLAPFGFLIFQRAIASILGGRNHVLRFLPLAAGIAVARPLLSPGASRPAPPGALVALALFAFSADLVYYSNEMKPYSLDVAFGLAITLMAVGAMGRTPSPRSLVWLAVLAACAPWFSFSSAFIVAGCGTVLLADALVAGRYRIALLWVLIGAGWLANFLVSYQASRAILSPYTTMYLFWDFAFLPFAVPPTRDMLLKDAGLLLEVFVNPLNLLAPTRLPIRSRHPPDPARGGVRLPGPARGQDLRYAHPADRAGRRRVGLPPLPVPWPADARAGPGPVPPGRRRHRDDKRSLPQPFRYRQEDDPGGIARLSMLVRSLRYLDDAGSRFQPARRPPSQRLHRYSQWTAKTGRGKPVNV